MAADDADLIRLIVPADPSLGALAEVTVAVLARRAGFSEEEIAAGRSAAAAAFAEVIQSDALDGVELEVRVSPHSIVARIGHGERARSVVLP